MANGRGVLATRLAHRVFGNQRGAWGRASINGQIMNAFLIVALGTVAAKLVALVKDQVVAFHLGVGDALDVYFIALLIPGLVASVVGGAFVSALVPTLVGVRNAHGQAGEQRLLSSVMIIAGLLLAALTVGIMLVAPYLLPVLGSGFDAGKLATTWQLLLVLLPLVLINGFVVLWGGVLNAGKRFGLSALAPIFTSLSIIVCLSLLHQQGVYALAWATLLGAVLELLLLAVALRRRGYRLLPRWYGFDEPLRQVIRQYFPMVASGLLMSGTWMVDQAMAAMLEPGSVAALNYAIKIPAVLTSLGSVALGTAVLPYFSELVAAADWTAIRQTFNSYLGLIILVTLPVTGVLVYLSEPIVTVLFQRGTFGADDSLLVSSIQSFYLLQIPGYLVGILMVRLISSLKANIILVYSAVISLTANIVCNYLLMQWFGVAGIALSTAVIYSLAAIYLGCRLQSLLGTKS